MPSLFEMAQADNAAADAASGAAATATDTGAADTGLTTAQETAGATAGGGQADAGAATGGDAGDGTGAAAGTTDDAGAVETADAYPLLVERATEVLGSTPGILGKYKSMDDFLRGVAELDAAHGRQSAEVAAMRYLQENGLSPENYQDVLTFLQQRRNGQPGNGQPAAPQERWQDWITEDANGNTVLREGAPPTAKTEYLRQVKLMREAMLDPSKMAELLAPHLQPKIAEATQRVRVESEQARVQAELANEQNNWLRDHAKEIYVDGDQAKGFSPLGRKADELLRDQTVNPALPPAERFDRARKLALAMLQPPPTAVKPAAKGAQRQGTVAQAAKPTRTWQEVAAKIKRPLTLKEHMLLTEGKPIPGFDG